MELTHIEDTFIDIGGQFFTSAFDLREKLSGIKALIFDWDGVFNDGRKGTDNSTNYSEIDSLGVEMLRFGFMLANKTQIKTAIITGEQDKVCLNWARDHNFDAVYTNAQNKISCLEHFCDSHGVKPSEVIYIFDDILDVPVAKKSGIRLAVGRLCNPLFMEYLERNKLVDYFSSCQGNEHVVREFCELLLCLLEQQFAVIEERAAYSDKYLTFRAEKKVNQTTIYRFENDGILEDQPS